MSATPDVSVVMGVFNGAATLAGTLDSVLRQSGCEFEFVVIDDGSTDSSADILDDYSTRDSRLRVTHQARVGLTRALIRGCDEARGQYIARQDAGDVSLPGRLAIQADMLAARPELTFVSCRYALVGPGNEPLTDSASANNVATDSLPGADGQKLPSPHHGSVMFRKSAYYQVGGYRPEFYYAQDVDLWSRLIEIGGLGCATEVLYQVRFEFDSITARHRPAQQRLRALVVEAAALRHAGESDAEVLRRAAEIRPGGKVPVSVDDSHGRAAAAYFVGSCLQRQGDPRARTYLLETLRHDPLHVRSWYKLLRLTIAARGPTE